MAKYRRHYSRGKIGGSMKGILWDAVAGIADNVIDSYSPIDGLGALMIGMFAHKPFLTELGAYKAGFSAGNMLPLPRGSSGSGGNFT